MPYLGPAFFTKFLFFAVANPPGIKPQPLILDSRVAQTLRTKYGWSIGSANWPSAKYAQYLEFVSKVCRANPETTPEEVEFALFDGGRTEGIRLPSCGSE